MYNSQELPPRAAQNRIFDHQRKACMQMGTRYNPSGGHSRTLHASSVVSVMHRAQQ